MKSLRLLLLYILMGKEVAVMAVVYATLIVKGKKTIDQVPSLIRKQVEEILADLSHGKAHGERGRLPLFPHSCYSAQAEFPALHPAMPPRQKAA